MSDILLLITTICLLLLTAALVSIAIVAFKILMDLKEIFHIIRHESSFIAGDVHEFRQRIKERAGTIDKVAGIFIAGKAAKTFFNLLGGGKKETIGMDPLLPVANGLFTADERLFEWVAIGALALVLLGFVAITLSLLYHWYTYEKGVRFLSVGTAVYFVVSSIFIIHIFASFSNLMLAL